MRTKSKKGGFKKLLKFSVLSLEDCHPGYSIYIEDCHPGYSIYIEDCHPGYSIYIEDCHPGYSIYMYVCTPLVLLRNIFACLLFKGKGFVESFAE